MRVEKFQRLTIHQKFLLNQISFYMTETELKKGKQQTKNIKLLCDFL